MALLMTKRPIDSLLVVQQYGGHKPARVRELAAKPYRAQATCPRRPSEQTAGPRFDRHSSLVTGPAERERRIVTGPGTGSGTDLSLVIPDYGHWIAEQAPEELLAALTAFLATYRDRR
jgi:hypothetical protein